MIIENELGTFENNKLEKAEPFHCDRCNKDKTSKSIIKHIDKEGKKQTLCNGCYGWLLANK